MDDLRETAVIPALTTRWLGRSYRYLETTTSTNDVLKEMAAEGVPAGSVLAANFQSRGRGRLDRRWEAAPGTSLMVSLLLRPEWPAAQALWLTMMAGLATAEAVERLSPLSVLLKWPNDVGVLLAGQWHKMGGLLVEGNVRENGRLRYAVVGLGLNVNMTTAQLPEGMTPVTSILAASGVRVARRALLLAFLERMEMWYEAAAAGRSPREAWQERLITIGRQVQASFGGQVVMGTAVGVDEFGQLMIEDEAGQTQTITAGDVTLRGRLP
jgi:BirA family biotin operon repressor/biotin-[acetyl-CoA-carboxylase] ligase